VEKLTLLHLCLLELGHVVKLTGYWEPGEELYGGTPGGRKVNWYIQPAYTTGITLDVLLLKKTKTISFCIFFFPSVIKIIMGIIFCHYAYVKLRIFLLLLV
jgi:hypothetical protein